jgi:uncharacterized membrane protein
MYYLKRYFIHPIIRLFVSPLLLTLLILAMAAFSITWIFKPKIMNDYTSGIIVSEE